MRGIKKVLIRVGLMGSFALVVLSHGATARADGSSPDNFWNTVMSDRKAASHVFLPSAVRAARTPSKPVHVTPPIGISVTKGSLVYLKPHHRDPAMMFEIKLSRAPGKGEVTVNYATTGSTPLADSEFDNVNGTAIFHGSVVHYKVYAPVIAPFVSNKTNYIVLQLFDPTDGAISVPQGVAYLVGKVK
jgi:hypothetical protein